MNAMKVAPNHYKLLADTMGIRMVEVNYNPGDSAPMHWHPDYAIYVVQGGTVTFYGKDGSKMENTLPSGATMIRPAEWHAAKNSGKTPIKVILTEVTRNGGMTSPDATLDATKVASKLYKAVADTLGIRIVEVDYKPGESSAMHSHPDLALYVVEAGKAEFTRKDGSKQVMDLTKGMAAIVPADAHAAKNVGKTRFKGILVEVNRK
jgi:quercetin dioxygenase-like cupin family protein